MWPNNIEDCVNHTCKLTCKMLAYNPTQISLHRSGPALVRRDGGVLWGACLFMCLFVCLGACVRNEKSDLRKFLCVLPMAVSRSSGGVEIRYVLPVSWMTSCRHIMRRMSIPLQRVTSVSPRVQSNDPAASYWLRHVLDDCESIVQGVSPCRGRSLQCTTVL